MKHTYVLCMSQVSTADISTATSHLDGNVPPIIVSVILEHATEAHFLYRRHSCIPLAGRHLKLSIHLQRCSQQAPHIALPGDGYRPQHSNAQNLAMMQLPHLNVATAAAEALEMCMMSEHSDSNTGCSAQKAHKLQNQLQDVRGIYKLTWGPPSTAARPAWSAQQQQTLCCSRHVGISGLPSGKVSG